MNARNSVVYEVSAAVAPELVAQYEQYMRERHIPDLMATGHFQTTSFARSAVGRYRISCVARNQQSLDTYLNGDAVNLRADFLRHFPAGVELSREVWTVVQKW